MKRGKDDEKTAGPMFPRLHVNDTEKGGPRAPPRNKMALYEQLSIPSQRFNTGVVPLNPSNTSSLVPPGSSSQGSSLERNMLLPSRISLSMSNHPSEKFHASQHGVASVKASFARLEQRKKVRDEDDFMVPVFVNSETGQQHNNIKNGFDGEKLTPLGPTYFGSQIKVQTVRDKDPNRSGSSVVNLRKETREQSEESSQACISGGHSVKSAADLSTREKIDGHAEEGNGSPGQGCGEHFASRVSRSNENDICSAQELRVGREAADREAPIPRQRSMSYSEGNQSGPDETNNDSEHCGDKACVSVQLANGDRSDDVSETSMVDSISGLDISPDDVVGIIGQKHFWKARRAIANQQRVFAVQVFELHRLIKVQKLIAGSPHILLEDTTYLSKPSFKGSPAKKLPSEFSVKPLLHAKRKDDSEKSSHKMECSAENAVGRTSLSLVKSGTQPSNCTPLPGNQPSAPVNGDNKMNHLGFPQMHGHQWLVPVMSPSEGLIYKPYPGPGVMGSAYGGCGPFGQTPMPGNFMTSAYGVPAPHLGIGVLPGAPPVGHSYFPPYGMPVMNQEVSGSVAEQMNQFAGPGPYAPYGQLSGGGANFNMQHQSSCNLPSEKNGAVSHVRKVQASKDTELQGSTASSPGERVQRFGTNNAEGKNALSLFPTDPAIPEGGVQPHETDRRTRVIKVVPHNAMSATESAARIFQSIQRERKQYDSV